jgi:hypothetical protein
MISWQARSMGFETSDPFFFVMRSPTISDAVRDVAVDWVEANIDMLVSPPGLPGDYNDDGSVDAADYVVWRKTLGQIGEDLPADGDGSGQIDSGDFTVWKANFGNTLSPGGASSTAVPEAGIWPIVTAGVFGIALMRNRRVNRSIRLAIRGPIVILDERVIICRRMERKGSL